MRKIVVLLTCIFIVSISFAQDIALITENDHYEQVLGNIGSDKVETNANFIQTESSAGMTFYTFNEKKLYQSETVKKYENRKEAIQSAEKLLAYFAANQINVVNTQSTENKTEYIATRKGEVFKLEVKELSKTLFEVRMTTRKVQNIPAEKREKYDFLAMETK
ncbi:MAG: hypothetical protein ACKVTZ_23835 [Bacteroidia bacterium]